MKHPSESSFSTPPFPHNTHAGKLNSSLPLSSLKTGTKIVRILLVEDCKTDVLLLENLMENASINCFYEMVDVPRLTDAFQKITHETFDLIILDLNLLDIDGVDSIAALRAEAPEIPIIVYSGSDDAKMRQDALSCGATHYLVKGRECGAGLKSIIEKMVTEEPQS